MKKSVMGKNKEGLEIHCAEGRYEVFADQILWSELTGEKMSINLSNKRYSQYS